jgi:3-hydroxyacyl-CoA dehydrogenase
MADQTVEWIRRGDIALLVISNPPLNALKPTTTIELVAGVRRSEGDPGVKATVLIGANETFIAGADIRQLGGPSTPPGQRATDLIDLGEKPVVAAIDGFAVGGGLEIAMACHGRVATARAEMGLSETLLGVIPGGGGTQRLPRLVGVERALDLILSGRRCKSAEALKLGLVDQVIESPDELEKAASAFALSLCGKVQTRRIRDMPVSGTPDERARLFAAARRRADATKGGNRHALHGAIDAVEAACGLALSEGMLREQHIFGTLVNTVEAKALRYAFFAEREARRVPGMPASSVFPSAQRAAVVGAGTMGAGIAMTFAEAGIPVLLMDVDAEATRRGQERIAATYMASVKRGSLSSDEMSRRMALIGLAGSYEQIAESDAVVEAAFESLPIKQKIFSILADCTKPGTLLLSNTSTIDIDLIAAGNPRIADIAGAHFFSPANVMKLVEVVVGLSTSATTLARTFELSRKLAKVPVVAGSCDGFVANRSRMPFQTEVQLMLEEGASPEQIDRVMMAFGYPVGPFMVGDIAGLDIGYAVRKLSAEKDPNFRKLPIPDRLVEMGRHGQKAGAGWYRYESGSRTPQQDPVVAEIIEQVRRERGITPRALSDEEVLHRPLFGAVNEACRILEEGMAVRPSDIDVMWLHGFGFPRQHGGLMHWADRIGASAILRQYDHWAERLGPRWSPCDLLIETARSGQPLCDTPTRWHLQHRD